ncbi:MAG: hypothetical protein MH321_13820 [Leptospiraceae bacterium]|nr:hypothetical protein [Leptospiraceae bacterium]
MTYKILIAGSGQLGTRYLQGLYPVSSPLEIFVFDKSKEALNLAAQRWGEVSSDVTKHNINYISDVNDLPSFFSVCIVATTADVRLDVVKIILNQSNIKYWILEKVLTQSIADLLNLGELLKNSDGVWVNTPMHLWSLYQNLKDVSEKNVPLKASYLDIRGLACNAIHYIDLIGRWNSTKIYRIDTDGLNTEWYPSTRNGFWDIYGELKVFFEDGSELLLTSKELDRNFRIQIKIRDKSWEVFERDGIAKCSDGTEILGTCEYQSSLTKKLIEDIQNQNKILLPTLSESIEQHTIFIRSLLLHYEQSIKKESTILPIT